MSEQGHETKAAARIYGAFQVFVNTLNAYAASPEYDSTTICEAAAEHKLDAEPFSQFIMQYFGWETGQNTALKRFLIEVGAGLGPDHIQNLRQSGAFMAKMESF